MDLSDLESALPIRGESSEKLGEFGVTWLEPPPSSGSSLALRGSNAETSSELPAAGHLHSCEYCEWGYFGNEASDVDFYNSQWHQVSRFTAVASSTTSSEGHPASCLAAAG